MKKASELGLKIIELKDQILLIDDRISVNQIWGYDPERNQVGIFYGSPTESPYVEIIASKEKIVDIPLLVIEDEVERLADRSSEMQEGTYTPPHKITYCHGFIDGYKNHQKTHPFTEDELRKAFWFGKEWLMDLPEEYIEHNYGISNSDSMNDNQVFDALVKSLAKKELWIEVEEKLGDEGIVAHALGECEYFPKITNNQLKATWK